MGREIQRRRKYCPYLGVKFSTKSCEGPGVIGLQRVDGRVGEGGGRGVERFACNRDGIEIFGRESFTGLLFSIIGPMTVRLIPF